MCDSFVDYKLSIYFDYDKTKSIRFDFKHKTKKLQKLEIIYNNIQIKQHFRVTHLGCILEKTISGESMSYKVISKINARLKFIHQKSKYLTPNLCHLLCNSLIQPHVCFALHSTLIIPKNWKTNFKFHKINVFVPVYSWVKCCIYLKKNYNQLVGCPLKKNIISVQIPLPSDTLITNAPIIWMKFL